MFRIILVFLSFLVYHQVESQNEITLEDIWSNRVYYTNSVPGFNFLQNGRNYTRLEGGSINKYDLETGEFVESILETNGLEGFEGRLNSYDFSSSENFIVLKANSESIYRRSSKANFYVFDRVNEKLSEVAPGIKVGYATMSPDEKKIAYTNENNLFVKDIESGKTEQVSYDGEYNHIINGSADWVYEEEFGFAKAFFWSPDSKRIAYLKFNEKDVKEYTIVKHRGDLYPEFHSFKYPKVGEKNALVSSHIYALDDKKTLDVKIEESDFYIPRLKWKSGLELIVFKLNRHQNHLQLINVNAGNGNQEILLEEKNKYYVDIHDNLSFLENGESFIWTSEQSGYDHIHLHTPNGNKDLTPGNFDVTSFYGIDKKRGLIYYQAAKKNPMERQVYQVNLDGSGTKEIISNNGYNSVQFSSTFDYYVLNHSDINTPASYQVFKNDGSFVRSIETNEEIKGKQEAMEVQKMEFFQFKTSENVALNGWIIKPVDFDASKKYPVFMTLYGGPGSQTVTDSWKGTNYWWYQHLAQKGYVVASIDNRGTGARGEAFKKMTYQQLGKYETIDQIEGAKYLASLEYTDPNRIGVFGWSYGGYMSSLCLLKGNDVFKAAIAVAPVTSWKWYDSIYTERYMRTEEENPEGYRENSPVYFADMLKGKYLLVHGNADDNVHFQHSAEMANALIKANKQFETYFYPARNHGIYGDNARLHLYTKMTNFILENI